MDPFDLVPLKSVEIQDFHGWRIPMRGLQTFRREVRPFTYIHDAFVEAPSAQYACLQYTIFEQRMGWYMGHVALFENKPAPRLLVCSAPAMMHAHPRPQFLGDLCVLRAPAFHKDPALAGDPLIVVDLRGRTFAFIDVSLTSCWYEVTPIGSGTVRIRGNENIPATARDRATPEQVINLATLPRFPLDQLFDYTTKFWQTRRGS